MQLACLSLNAPSGTVSVTVEIARYSHLRVCSTLEVAQRLMSIRSAQAGGGLFVMLLA